jgi:hypothetical protein
MYTIHGTAKILAKVKPQLREPAVADTRLGNWYATTMPWRPQVALFVNQTTLLPVFMPLAPARTVADRLPTQLAEVLSAMGIDPAFIAEEIGAMTGPVWATTASRSVIGSMTDFAFLAGHHRDLHGPTDLVALSARLARTPCSPLYKTYHSPDLAVAALASQTRR